MKGPSEKTLKVNWIGMLRIPKLILFVVGLSWPSWTGMQVTHELGHVLGALLTGGTVECIDLHPFRISRTDVRPNPSPLPVIWLGPILGTVIPCLAWQIARTRKSEWKEPLRFFAGFCLIANGAYLGSAVSNPVGDASDLLNHGAHRWQLLLFAVVTISLGLFTWNGVMTHLRRVSNSKLGVVWGTMIGVLILLLTIYW